MTIINFPKHRITKPKWYMLWKNANKKNWIKLWFQAIPVILAIALVAFIAYKINHGI